MCFAFAKTANSPLGLHRVALARLIPEEDKKRKNPESEIWDRLASACDATKRNQREASFSFLASSSVECTAKFDLPR
jgi:hypothetical protein